MSEYQKVRLAAAHGPDVHFEGKLIHEFSTQRADGGKDRWSELRLWESRGGAWIAESVGCSTRGNEREIREVTVLDAVASLTGAGVTPDMATEWNDMWETRHRTAVMEAFGWTSASKAFAREMGWSVIRHVD